MPKNPITSSTIITATLDSIRYQGDQNFIIGSFVIQKNGKRMVLSCLGNIVKPQPGMDYKLSGQWENNKQYGKQFKFKHYQQIKPVDTNGIFKYLVRSAKFVGPTTASHLLDTYGGQTLEVLRSDPELVSAEIPRLSLSKAKQIQNDLVENEDIESALVELMAILTIPNLPKSLPMTLIDKHGSDAVGILRSNPYILTEIQGIGFILADNLAINVLKIQPDSSFRIEAAINHGLKSHLRETGSTWVACGGLIEIVRNLISLEVEKIQNIVDVMIVKGDLVEGTAGLTFIHIEIDENLISRKIREMAGG